MSHTLTRALRHNPIVLMGEDNAALLEDLVEALRDRYACWKGLSVMEVEETVRRSHRDGRPRFQILPDAQGRRWIRATGGHTFRTKGIKRRQKLISCALVQHCRKAAKGNSVSLSQLVRVAKEKVPSITEEDVLLVLEHETHTYDDRHRFQQVYEDGEWRFSATESSKPWLRQRMGRTQAAGC